MVLIEEILVSDEVLKNRFQCDLNACKGACCYEGDYGAPLEKDEIENFHSPPKVVLDMLPKEAVLKINADGGTQFYKDNKKQGTNLMENGACVFLAKEGDISYCAVEMAYKNDLIEFNKPISCHLYPIRVSKNEHTGFEALNYDEWDICSAACDLGKKNQMPMYKFCKDAILRAYGQDFYDAMDDAAKMLDLKK